MYIAFDNIDALTKSKVLNVIGNKFIMRYGDVPEDNEEFEEKFNKLELDKNIVGILKESYGKTGYTVSYSVSQLKDEYLNSMK